VYAQKQAAGDYAVAEIVKDISPNACQHVHLIGAFDFEQTESQTDIDALAARYDDPDFWNRALVEAPDDSLTQPLDRTFTVLERWAFLSNFRRCRVHMLGGRSSPQIDLGVAPCHFLKTK
jgi:hypothetical protein